MDQDQGMDYRTLSEELCQLHIRYAGRLNRLSSAVASRGEDGVLVYLAQQTQPVYAVDLIRHFDLTAGRVANILRQLEKKHYLTRLQDAEDLRRSQILLTEEGKQAADVLYGQMVDHHEQLLAGFSPEEAAGFLEVLSRLCRNSAAW